MSTVQFINNLSSSASPPPHIHDHGGGGHTHDHGDHGHTHEHLDNPGESPSYLRRSRSVANLRPTQGSMLSAKCPTSIQGALRSVDSPSGSGGERRLPTPSTLILSDTGSPVGSGKTALTLALCQRLRNAYNIGRSHHHSAKNLLNLHF